MGQSRHWSGQSLCWNTKLLEPPEEGLLYNVTLAY